MQKFWMVYVESRQYPIHKHETKALAREEAARLCHKDGQTAYVLEAVEMCQPAGVQWSIIKEPDENYPTLSTEEGTLPRQ